MIARIRDPEQPPPSSPLVRARRLVAATLLPSRQPIQHGPRIRRWKAWFFAGWVVLAVGAYVLHLAGVF